MDPGYGISTGAFRLQHLYSTRNKSPSTILGVMKRFVAEVGVPRAFRADSVAEYTNSTFADYYNGLGIRRERTTPYTPQQNGFAESRLLMAIKAGHAALIEAIKPFPDIHLERLKGVQDPGGSSLWLEPVLWASKGFNRSATTASIGMPYPHDGFSGGYPPLPFYKPANHRVPLRK